MKFHINKKGEPKPCKAIKGNCPLGNDTEHFNSLQEAQNYADLKNYQQVVIDNFIQEKDKYSYKTDDYLKLISNEPEITNDVQKITKENNGELYGLEFRLKEPESVKNKILIRRDAFNIQELWDVVRYTSVHSKETYYKDKDKILNEFKKQNFQIHSEKDTWDSDGYKGINVKIKHPNGTKFELQFHTKESLEAKQKAHIIYEAIRMPDIDLQKKIELEKEMNELFKISKPKK